ncbi:MAG: GDSL-type esterase/lipase family protein [Candidatus Omnitrophica bacterium]|nr:GDSL-type esterase/lipase family protein [Candidatus Omnitrophota bacterium]
MRINKIVVTLVVVAALCALFFIAMTYSKKEIRNLNSTGKNIICFGDSVTYGYGVNLGEDYPTALAKLVNRKVINAGVDGDTSLDGLKRIKSDVLDKKPYLVLIEFTGNDFIKKIPIDLTIANIKEMILLAQAQGSIVAIVDVSAGLFLRDYRVRLDKLARETGAIFVPAVLNKILTNPSMKSDFMHPNVAGYKIVAQRVYSAIAPYLGKRGQN